MKPQIKKTSTILILVLFLFSLFMIGGSVFAGELEQRAQFAAPKLVVNTSFLNVRTGPGVQYSVLVTVVGGTELPVLGVANDRVWYQVSTAVGVGWVNVQFTLPRGEFGAVPFAAAPVVSGGLVIDNAASLGQGGGGGAPSSSGSTAGRPWGVSILGGDLHALPSTTSQKLRTALSEDRTRIFPLLGAIYAEGTPWYQVSIPGSATGWLQAQFVFLRPLKCAANVGVSIIVRDTGFNSGPDAIKVPEYGIGIGQEVYVLDIREGLVKVELLDGAVGWVSIESTVGRDDSKITSFCEGVSASSGGSTTTSSGATTASLAAPRVVINTGFLNVRSGPGAQFTVVATLPGGTEVPVIGIASDKVWYLVQGTFGQGWVNKEFVLFRGDGRNLPIIRNATGSLSTPVATINGTVTLFAAPNATFGSVGAISGPVQVQVVARTADFAWVQLNTAIGFGWVPASQVTLGGDTSLIPIVQ